MPYIPTDCYSPRADGKIHYIIKGIGGNNLGFVPAIVLTSNRPFDVIKIYAERQTLNMCLPTKANTYSSSSCFTGFLSSLNTLQMLSGNCRYHICHCALACYCIKKNTFFFFDFLHHMPFILLLLYRGHGFANRSV